MMMINVRDDDDDDDNESWDTVLANRDIE